MSETNPTNTTKMDLLKYPVMALTALATLLVLQVGFGINLSNISEIGPSGLKLGAQKDLQVALSDLQGKIVALEKEVAELKKGDNSDPTKQASMVDAESELEVSDEVANLGRLGKGTILKGSRGWVYLGRLDASGNWDRFSMNVQQPVDPANMGVLKGRQLRVQANLNLRDGLPNNDADYYRGRKMLGVIPTGTLVRILKEPVLVERAVPEVWVSVEVLE